MQRPGDEIVAKLRREPASDAAQVEDVATDAFEHGRCTFEVALAASDHERKRRRGGAAGPSAHRRVEESDAAFCKPGGDALGRCGIDGREIDAQHSAGSCAPRAIVAEEDLERMLRRHTARAQHVDLRCHFTQRRSFAGPCIAKTRNGGGIAAMNEDVVPCADQVGGHRCPHEPKPHEADLHRHPPCARAARAWLGLARRRRVDRRSRIHDTQSSRRGDRRRQRHRRCNGPSHGLARLASGCRRSRRCCGRARCARHRRGSVRDRPRERGGRRAHGRADRRRGKHARRAGRRGRRLPGRIAARAAAA